MSADHNTHPEQWTKQNAEFLEIMGKHGGHFEI